jgi:hypothetical protein
MTAAYRLKGVGWLGASVAIVLGFYLVSLQVAAERKRLDEVNGRIASAQRDIRALETEFDTRANLAQLEQWNGDTLALTAPVAAQFVTDEAALASLDLKGVPGVAEVRTAALVVPALPALAPTAPPALAQAAAAAPVQLAAAQPAVIRAAAVSRPLAARAMPVVAPVVEARRVETARVVAAVAKVRPQAVAMLDRKLLSDSTLGDLLASAKAEAGRRR